MPLRTIHFLPDSPYSNWYVNNCSNCGSDTHNEFYCIWENPKYIDRSLIKVIGVASTELEKIVTELNEPTNKINLYINYLESVQAQVINSIKNHAVKIVWLVWSEDFYGLPRLRFKKFDRYSLKYLKAKEKLDKQAQSITFKQRLGRLKMIYWDGIDLNGKRKFPGIYNAITRIDYCATPFGEEVKIIQQKLNNKIKWQPFAFISATNGLDISDCFNTTKELIQVGNSADPANNQYEAVVKLNKLGVKDKILLPLSYGDAEYTSQFVTDISAFIKADQLLVLNQYIEKDEYYNLLKRVKTAIFAHNIHQAFGNIIALIAFGAKIFLKKKNPLYSQLTMWGLHVFSIEDDMTLHSVSTALDIETMRINQNIVFSILSQEKINEYYRNLLAL